MHAKKGDWVQIQQILLKPEERTAPLPEDTQKVPLMMRIKGFLINETAEIGQEVEIKTLTGRLVKGELVAINPKYEHDFGEPVPELITVGLELRKILEGDNNV
ncbi:2-amino-4-oxopentanoate thiolase subunit OrtA [Thermosipho sp. 1070]|uniref:2-amino-4-oxopentanoate thiolase subunit OrtA n=1 Tax=Thermosipho sp. 1070 TaxID=1437364 RepID=UPI000949229D|nr:2-amino-4-oxopentanoate thiolase subunit OrtA [Thermosipho sp. 1070]ANQ53837.1 2-amino-4-ketopentanoate thiolase subunit alpha [Thermosipho sp. 1070]